MGADPRISKIYQALSAQILNFRAAAQDEHELLDMCVVLLNNEIGAAFQGTGDTCWLVRYSATPTTDKIWGQPSSTFQFELRWRKHARGSQLVTTESVVLWFEVPVPEAPRMVIDHETQPHA